MDPYQVYWISPSVLEDTVYGLEDVPDLASVSGMVKSGDWDRKTLPLENLIVIRAAKERFIKGMAWADTEYYRNALERISKPEGFYWCRNKEDLDRHCRRIDRLYEEIRDNGYKSQQDLRAVEAVETEWGEAARVEHEIAVHIDRDGRFLFCDGRHRLGIVLALGIERIPVKVCIRHAGWQAFCCEILKVAERNGGKVYQPLTHPDLQRIPSAHGEDRFEIIRHHIPPSGHILDIGANWGYFCHRFEELGYNCYAVEYNPENTYFLDKLRTAQNRRFTIIQQSILTYTERSRFDVVLALNIFHHFLKTEHDYNALLSFLQRMDMDVMIFQPHHTWEPQMTGAHANYEPDEFVALLLRHSCLNNSALVGEAEDGRPIYKLWK